MRRSFLDLPPNPTSTLFENLVPPEKALHYLAGNLFAYCTLLNQKREKMYLRVKAEMGRDICRSIATLHRDIDYPISVCFKVLPPE